jgi:GntR family transcriptional regulator/MocR family aminotransferase
MKELLIEMKRGSQPKYQKLAESLRNSIRSGRVVPGEVLPSSRELARRLKMNRHTIMRAFAELIAEGWISGNEKKCYQVTPQLPTEFLRVRPSIIPRDFFSRKNLVLARISQLPEYPVHASPKHAFPSGYPDVRQFPMREFKSHMYDALKRTKNLSYGDPAGHPNLQAQIKTYLRRIRGLDQREIIITNGSQEAIFYLAQLLVHPGDGVAVEALGYPPAMAALRFAGAKLLPVNLDQQGLRVEDLKRLLKKHRVRMLYTTPLHQYPTTVSLSAARRLELYELCYNQDILILEDDYDHEFHYSSQPIAPLAANDPAGIVLYVSTFSKILFPSARVGFMAIPAELAREVVKLKRISSRQNEQLIQDAIAGWMASGGFERHLRKMRRTYDERRTEMLEDLLNFKKKYPQIAWQDPDGGMALWLNLSCDSFQFAEVAKRHGIYVNPEANYRLDQHPGTHLRLGFSGQTPLENRAGLNVLFKIFSSCRR